MSTNITTPDAVETTTPLPSSEDTAAEHGAEQSGVQFGIAPVEALARDFGGEELYSGGGSTAENRREEEGESNLRLAFRIGEIGLMIRSEDGSELTDVPFLHHLPNTPRWLLGMVNLHGRLLPVFDLLSYFNLERGERNEKPMLLVLGHDTDAAGVIIDGLPRRIRWTRRQEGGMDTAHKVLRPHIETACVIEREVWFDLNTASFLAAIEQDLAAV